MTVSHIPYRFGPHLRNWLLNKDYRQRCRRCSYKAAAANAAPAAIAAAAPAAPAPIAAATAAPAPIAAATAAPAPIAATAAASNCTAARKRWQVSGGAVTRILLHIFHRFCCFALISRVIYTL